MVLGRWLFNNSKKFILRTKGELKVIHFEQNIEYFNEHENVIPIELVIFQNSSFLFAKKIYPSKFVEWNQQKIVLTR